MDITPTIAADRQQIRAYGDGGFRVNDVRWAGSVLVFPSRTLAWPVASLAELSLESLAPVLAEEPKVEVLILGCGPSMGLVPRSLRDALRSHGIVVEAMDTGAACRTYGVLLAEDRRIATALIAV